MLIWSGMHSPLDHPARTAYNIHIDKALRTLLAGKGQEVLFLIFMSAEQAQDG